LAQTSLAGSATPKRWPTVHLEDWQALGIVCGALLALLALVGTLARKVVRPMWRFLRSATQLVEQLTGDKDKGVPSLMDRLEMLNNNQTEQGRRLSEHLEWHGNPGGQPARPTPTRPNRAGH
jgi:hypothetical protein